MSSLSICLASARLLCITSQFCHFIERQFRRPVYADEDAAWDNVSDREGQVLVHIPVYILPVICDPNEFNIQDNFYGLAMLMQIYLP